MTGTPDTIAAAAPNWSMDVARNSNRKARRVRQRAYIAAGCLALATVTIALSRLKPACPTVEKNSIWTDTVRRSDMLRAVSGPGTLVPVEVRWVPAVSAGRVERIRVLPGTAVNPDTVIVELSSPELKQEALDAEWSSKAAEAELTNLRVSLQTQRLTQEALLASVKYDYSQAELEAQADEELAKLGLVPKLVAKRSRAKADELKNRSEIEKQRLAISGDAAEAQLAVQEAKLQQLRAQANLRAEQVRGLEIRAGISGVLQKLGDKDTLQVGQQLAAGANVARVADPLRLRAEIKIGETQARDVQLGQRATVDTRNGVADGRVIRIDPAVQNGTVLVDVEFTSALPKGARPDLTVEGIVQLERLQNVLNVGRPVQGQPESTAALFKIVDGGRHAVRVPVKLGRSSVNTIEIVQGLQSGDQVILSDMSRWETQDRVRLR